DGTGLGGVPALRSRTLRLEKVTRTTGGVSARVRTGETGTLRLYLWDGSTILGTVDAQEVDKGMTTTDVPLTGGPAEGASLHLVASFENDAGTAAAATTVE
ncbi:MAG: hypothetical protein ACTIN5_15485, partial [Brachybacterium tyrofermentans]